ncbi:MAG: DUF433 domain-containing protein [Verrucomicrobiota bacterium]|nr:DUF433 domain-containing protein [Verrucomicrobiota bacterium]
MKFAAITVNPEQMGGVPCIRNLRIPVATILKLMDEGSAEYEILQLYPDLTLADVREALAYSARVLEEREILAS